MIAWCLKLHVNASGLFSSLQPVINITYMKSAADNIICEFSPCVLWAHVETKGGLRIHDIIFCCSVGPGHLLKGPC